MEKKGDVKKGISLRRRKTAKKLVIGPPRYSIFLPLHQTNKTSNSTSPQANPYASYAWG